MLKVNLEKIKKYYLKIFVNKKIILKNKFYHHL